MLELTERAAQKPNPGLVQEIYVPSDSPTRVLEDFGEFTKAPTDLSNYFVTANLYRVRYPQSWNMRVHQVAAGQPASSLAMRGIRF